MKRQAQTDSTYPHGCPCAWHRGESTFAHKFGCNPVVLESMVKGALRSNLGVGERDAAATNPRFLRGPVHLLVEMEDIPVVDAPVSHWLAKVVQSYLAQTGGRVVNCREIELAHDKSCADEMGAADAWLKLDLYTNLEDPRRELEQFLNLSFHEPGLVGPTAVYNLVVGGRQVF